MIELFHKPAPQVAWYLQIKDDMPKSKRRIDHMTIKQINEMYRDNKFLCDTCTKIFDKVNFTLAEHITHLINPSILWSCDECIDDDIKNGRVIAYGEWDHA